MRALIRSFRSAAVLALLTVSFHDDQTDSLHSQLETTQLVRIGCIPCHGESTRKHGAESCGHGWSGVARKGS